MTLKNFLASYRISYLAHYFKNLFINGRLFVLPLIFTALTACQGAGNTEDLQTGISIDTNTTITDVGNPLKVEVLSTSGTYVLSATDTLAVGKTVYRDRDYTFTDIPASYDGLLYLRTVNDDKFNSAPDYLQFNVNKPVTVFVGFTTEATTLPSWLDSWTNTGEQLGLSAGSRQLYQKDFPSGTVVLGGNEVGYSMYVVVLKDKECVDNYTCTVVQNKEINLTWNPNQDIINGYKMYFGTTQDTVTQLASELPITAVGFNSQAPSVKFNAADDLGLQPGQNACFRLSAYNDYGESPLSAPVCVSI